MSITDRLFSKCIRTFLNTVILIPVVLSLNTILNITKYTNYGVIIVVLILACIPGIVCNFFLSLKRKIDTIEKLTHYYSDVASKTKSWFYGNIVASVLLLILSVVICYNPLDELAEEYPNSYDVLFLDFDADSSTLDIMKILPNPIFENIMSTADIIYQGSLLDSSDAEKMDRESDKLLSKWEESTSTMIDGLRTLLLILLADAVTLDNIRRYINYTKYKRRLLEC